MVQAVLKLGGRDVVVWRGGVEGGGINKQTNKQTTQKQWALAGTTVFLRRPQSLNVSAIIIATNSEASVVHTSRTSASVRVSTWLNPLSQNGR
jgi:hypothetical protein